MASWQPPDEYIQAVHAMLTAAGSTDGREQASAYEVLSSHKEDEAFVRTLTYAITSHALPVALGDRERAVGAAILKSIPLGKMGNDTILYIQSALPTLLAEENTTLRRVGVHLVSSIVREGGLVCWPELPSVLINGLQTSLAAVETAHGSNVLKAILSLVEQISCDAPQALEDEEFGCPVDSLYPLLISALNIPDVAVRVAALESLTNLQTCETPQLVACKTDFLTALGVLMGDGNSRVRNAVSNCLTTLVENSLVDVWPAMVSSTPAEAATATDSSIAAFQLRCLGDSECALNACSFWAVLVEQLRAINADDAHTNALLPYLPHVTSALVKLLVLRDEDLEGMSLVDVDDSGVPDREQDVNPAAKSGKHGASKNSDPSMKGVEYGGEEGATAAASDDDDDDDDDGGGDDDEKGGETDGDWSTRRAARHAIEILGIQYPIAVIDAAFPIIGDCLNATGDDDRSWRARECALAALADLSTGCSEVIEDRLPGILDYLLGMTTDSRPILRSSAIYTASHYCEWMVREYVTAEDEASRPPFLANYVRALVPRMLDHNKMVQHTALKAAVDCCNTAVEAVEEFFEDLLGTVLSGLPKYQLRSRLYAYDVIAALAENSAESFQNPTYVGAVVPALLHAFNALHDDSFEVTVLLGTLSAVVPVVSIHMVKDVADITRRAVVLLQRELLAEASNEQQQNVFGSGASYPRVANALDLLEAVADAGRAAAVELLREVGLFDMLPYVLRSRSHAVRQSGFALLGTLADTSMDSLEPIVNEVLDAVTAGIDGRPGGEIAASNACWAAGLIVLRANPEDSRPKLMGLLEKAAELLRLDDLPRVVYENLGVLIGTAASVACDLVAPGLAIIAPRWIRCMGFLINGGEKDRAINGFCDAVLANPSALCTTAAAKRPVSTLVNSIQLLLDYIGDEESPPTPAQVDKVRVTINALRSAADPAATAQLASALTATEMAQLQALLSS